jgi:hypothetical protein
MEVNDLVTVLLIGLGSGVALVLILRDIARHPRRWLDDGYWQGRGRRRRDLSPVSRNFPTSFREPSAPGMTPRDLGKRARPKLPDHAATVRWGDGGNAPI